VKCLWLFVEDSYYYDTGCGRAFQFETDGPKKNGFKFCPYCGRELETDHENETESEESGNTVA
jgi:rRNA maturation endonuclease Nob1